MDNKYIFVGLVSEERIEQEFFETRRVRGAAMYMTLNKEGEILGVGIEKAVFFDFGEEADEPLPIKEENFARQVIKEQKVSQEEFEYILDDLLYDIGIKLPKK